MGTSPDHPELQFVQAKEYGRGRPDGPPLWIIVHDMEAGETRTRAENTANYFATLPDGRVVSSHYCADNDSVVQCVRLADRAYTVGNRQGNNRGINWEFSGFASQTREQWLDEFGVAMFDQAAPFIRLDAAEHGIPLVRRTVAELKALKPGITSHNDLGLAFGGTTHTDPGPNFPWDYFISLLNGGDEDMTPVQNAMLTNVDAMLFWGMMNMHEKVKIPFPGDNPGAQPAMVDNQFAILLNKIAAQTGMTDEQFDALKAEVAEAAKAGAASAPQGPLSDVDVARVAKASVDVQASRLSA